MRKVIAIATLAMVVLFFSYINCYADTIWGNFTVSEEDAGKGIEVIAREHGVNRRDFLRWNKKFQRNPNHIQVGDRYRIGIGNKLAVVAVPDAVVFSEMDFVEEIRTDEIVSVTDIAQFVKANLGRVDADTIIKSVQVALMIMPGGGQQSNNLIGEKIAVADTSMDKISNDRKEEREKVTNKISPIGIWACVIFFVWFFLDQIGVALKLERDNNRYEIKLVIPRFGNRGITVT